MRICLRFDSLSLLQVVADVVLTSLNASTSTWQPFRFQPSIPTPAPVLAALPRARTRRPAQRPRRAAASNPPFSVVRSLHRAVGWCDSLTTVAAHHYSGADGRASALGSNGRAAHQHRLADSDVAPTGAL